MKAAEIRSTFLKYFESKGHTIVGSSPVIPATTRRCCSPTRA